MNSSRQPAASPSARAAFHSALASARLGAFALLALSVSCGGGGGSGTFTSAPPPPQATITITTNSLPVAIISQYYTQNLQASGGTGVYSWSLTSNSPPLPMGFNLNSAGLLSGVPTVRMSTSLSFQVRDSAGQLATKSLNLTVDQLLTITTTTLPPAVVGASYNFTLQATGGAPPYSWGFLPVTPLPSGMTLSSGGVLSGVPTTQFTSWPLAFSVRDSDGNSQSGGFYLNIVDVLRITTNAVANGIVSRNYLQNLNANGGAPPYTWSIAVGSLLPAGMGLDSAGNFTGAPSAAGSFSFVVRVSDTSGQSATKHLAMDVYSGPFVSSDPALPIIIALRPYSFTFQVTGGVPPFVWDLPATDPYGGPNNPMLIGLSLGTDGVLSGTTTAYGNWAFWVRITDSLGHSDCIRASLRMVLPLDLVAETLPSGNTEIQYIHQLYLNGGFGPYTWGLAPGSGPLPPGISLLPFGFLSGTPTAAGNFDFTVQLSDSINEVVTRSYNILIKNDVIITSYNTPYGVEGDAFSSPSPAAVGGTRPYTWSVTNGTLPPGLSMDPVTGQITGTPSLAGTFSFDLQATDSSNPPQSGRQHVGIMVRPPLSITTASLPDGAVNRPYYALIQADGGTVPPYSVRMTAGSLPAGFTMNSSSDSNGYFSVRGDPTVAGTSNFTLEVSDASTPPATVAKDFSIRINTQLRIDQGTASLPEIIVGQSFSYTFTATGGVPPYNWSVRYAPPGVTVDPATGVFSGTIAGPLPPGMGGIFADVHDSANPPQTTSQTFFWRIDELLKILTSQFPPIAVGVPVRMYPSLTGGTCCSYTWTVASGSLPPGLSLTDPVNGEIIGAASAAGTYNFSLQVKDTGSGSLAQLVSKSLSMVVKPASQLGRNDSIATATPLSNGDFRATLSPVDDGFGALDPDNDYYAITADPGAIVTIEAATDYTTNPGNTVDTVIEIVDASGTRYTADCRYNGTATFTNPCMNDDESPGNTNSLLYFKVPGTPGGTPLTFYVRVLEWTGGARPDFFYFIKISGAN